MTKQLQANSLWAYVQVLFQACCKEVISNESNSKISFLVGGFVLFLEEKVAR